MSTKKKKRITRQVRVETGVYAKLKERARSERITLSKLLDALISYALKSY